ncbi:LLM class flavin-dependent oxidoreductase [Nakamurella aerolata]|uniref:LLM class flavin-dependent oxidoreductase n=1 Tax=Nakamurella aerolata TaxID=1656892 RepID=A0A849A755_9ACTN|nr:LLM class flavin-dependent oxidoreductase [Nakamurella aerolata]NNG35466.1 LLM class flavin-dependent oxidoreductase [Nakamurella aerolata]
MRYENPLQLAEEAAALDIIADGRVALGVSRGSPEPALRGYEAFGYTGSKDPRGADLARDKFDLFMRAVDGDDVADADPNQYGPGVRLPIEPHSAGLREHIWWGSATRDSAKWTGEMGVNLMSSTLLTEDAGVPFHQLQAQQIETFRKAWKDAGHPGDPRASVSRSIFPIMDATDAAYFGIRRGGMDAHDTVGIIDGYRSTFGKTYAAEPDQLIEQLKADDAVMSADTVMLTIPNQLGPEYNLHILESFAKHVAPALGWQPNTDGPVTGYPIDQAIAAGADTVSTVG